MMTRNEIVPLVATVGLALGPTAIGVQAASRGVPPPVQLKQSRMIIEYNASAEDIGIQFFLDGDGWREIEIFDPRGKALFSAEAEGRLLRQGGGTELFLESVEPPLDELPLETFFSRFPAGVYRFRGADLIGGRIVGQDSFTHDVPAGPVVTQPAGATGDSCASGVGIPALIGWEAVTTSVLGAPLAMDKYEVIVENALVHFDIFLPATARTVLLPPELLQPGTDYKFEVLAIEPSGNQTITEGCFTTAP